MKIKLPYKKVNILKEIASIEGSFYHDKKLNFSPKKDKILGFYFNNQFIGTAKFNGQHLTYDSVKKESVLPWIVYYYNFQPTSLSAQQQ